MSSITYAYETARSNSNRSNSVKSSRRSDESYRPHSTAPTSPCESQRPSPRPSLQHSPSDGPKFVPISYDPRHSPASSPCRSSRQTYDSTVMSTGDLFEEPEEYDDLEYDLPEPMQEADEIETQPSTSEDFAQYFPTQRRLYIRHDDTTSDGNMNLRVETEIVEDRHRIRLQLFHLRMQDLKERQFSLRRYCRDSGREVCHSARRYTKPASERPGIQRSMSSAFATLRKPDFKRTNSGGLIAHSLGRQDSGYGSTGEDDFGDDVAAFMASEKFKPASLPMPTNTTKLEFSNYAQVDVKRRGGKNHKRYEFEYWGSTYRWRRVINSDSAEKTMSYHLIKDNSNRAIAHIVPEIRSLSQIREEEAAGGWVPPCNMWINDRSSGTDVADVIVATGLIALVDDCIKLHFHPKPKSTRQFSLPLTPLNLEYVGPKALAEHMFKRRNSAEKEKDLRLPSHSPLRQIIEVK